MEFEKLLSERRSIRKYREGSDVPRAAIEEMLRAAQQAPSWKNSQTGRYYVVITPEKVKKVRGSCLPEFNQKNSAGASAYIVTAFEKGIAGTSPDGKDVNVPANEWGAYDLGLQNEDLILKARELGFDTLIMGIRDEEALRAELSIPETQEIMAVIALGVRDIDPEAPKRKALDEIAVFF